MLRTPAYEYVCAQCDAPPSAGATAAHAAVRAATAATVERDKRFMEGARGERAYVVVHLASGQPPQTGGPGRLFDFLQAGCRARSNDYASRVEPSRDAILAALAGVIDPELQRPVTELDMVRDIEVSDGVVSLTIVLTIAGCPIRDSFERQVDEVLSAVPGVRGFSLSFGVMTPEERQKLTTKLRG